MTHPYHRRRFPVNSIIIPIIYPQMQALKIDQYFMMVLLFIHQQRHSFTKNMQIVQRFIDFMCIHSVKK